jgi:hypothetical protein
MIPYKLEHMFRFYMSITGSPWRFSLPISLLLLAFFFINLLVDFGSALACIHFACG